MFIYDKSGDVLLCGDFNARIASCNTFTADDNNMYKPVLANTTLMNKLETEIEKVKTANMTVDANIC